LSITSNKIVGIVGPKGSGKTYIAARQFGREDRAFCYQIVRTNTEYDIFATHVTDDLISAFKVMRKEEKFRIVYKVPDNDFVITKSRRIVYESCPVAANECYMEGGLTLYLDEAQRLIGQEWADPRTLRIIELARNQSMNIVWAAQSMEVDRAIRRNTDEHIFFYMWEPGDLAKVEERCGTATMERVTQLQRLKELPDGKIIPGEYLTWRAYE
jgi:hypothetical protein